MNMLYKSVVIGYAPAAKKMAAAIEKKSNEMDQKGWEFVSFSITNSAKAILVFRKPQDSPKQAQLKEEAGNAE